MSFFRWFQMVQGSLVILAAAATHGSEIIYDNSSTFLASFATERYEYGDQLDLEGSARTLTELAFEYYAELQQDGTKFCKLRIYTNEKPYDLFRRSPTTLLWESGLIALNAGYHSRRLFGLNVALPDSITVTIEFFGLLPHERAGFLLYSPPTIGHSFNEFWGRTPEGGWAPFLYSRTNPNLKANAGLQLVAVSSGSKPKIRVSASPQAAQENPHRESFFTFHREGDNSLPLSIPYTLEGSATVEEDYQVAPNDSPRVGQYEIQIKAGENEAVVRVIPIADHLREGPESVTVRLTPREDYEIDGESATLEISDDTVHPVKITIRPGGTHLRLEIEGEIGMRHFLEQSVDLKAWTVIRTNLVFSQIWIAEIPQASGETNYFYRVRR